MKTISKILAVCFFIGLHPVINAQQKKKFNIISYGAVADGKTVNTKTIQKTIDKAYENGGGVVVVPMGKFITGTLQLKTNVELHLEKDAVLLGNTDAFDYQQIDMPGHPVSPKQDDNSSLALLVAYKANNIAITGTGTIDGQGTTLALNIDSLIHIGKLKDPNYSYWGNRPNEKARPKLFRFSLCDNIHIENATLKNSACWGLSFELCSHLELKNIIVINRAYWNNDGMDITDCKNVKINNCDINSADDGICLKSYYPGNCNDSIYIDNCIVRSGASAIKFGTASYGGFKNVTINNVKIFDTFRSAIAIESVDGGDIENIHVNNIVAKNTGNAIFIRLGNRIKKKPGKVENIHLSNIEVQIPFGRPDINYDLRAGESGYHNPFASSITGIKDYKVKNIVLENIEITYPGRASRAQAYFPLYRLKDFPEKENNYPEYDMFGEMPAWGFYVRHAENISMKNVVLKLDNNDFRPAFVLDDLRNIELEKIMLPKGYIMHQIIAKDASPIQLKSSGELKVDILD